jgi:hypothetical protein
MERVELIAGREEIFQPVPLDHGSFEEGCRSVGVVLEEPGWMVAVPGEVEASVERGRFGFPGALNQGDGVLRNSQLREKVFRVNARSDRLLQLSAASGAAARMKAVAIRSRMSFPRPLNQTPCGGSPRVRSLPSAACTRLCSDWQRENWGRMVTEPSGPGHWLRRLQPWLE